MGDDEETWGSTPASAPPVSTTRMYSPTLPPRPCPPTRRPCPTAPTAPRPTPPCPATAPPAPTAAHTHASATASPARATSSHEDLYVKRHSPFVAIVLLLFLLSRNEHTPLHPHTLDGTPPSRAGPWERRPCCMCNDWVGAATPRRVKARDVFRPSHELLIFSTITSVDDD